MINLPRNKPVKVFTEEKYDNFLSISWDHSNVCNFKCSYCDENYNGGDNRFFSFSEIEPFLNYVKSTHQDKIVEWEIKGGEPTYWNDLPLFLKFAKENGWYSTLVTNGSASREWWRNYGPLASSICISFHPEFTDLNHLSEILPLIAPHSITTILFLLYPPYFDYVIKSAESLLSINENVKGKLLFVHDNKNSKLFDYSEEQIETASHFNQKYANVVSNSGFIPSRSDYSYFEFEDKKIEKIDSEVVKIKNYHAMKDWVCSAGINRIHIDTKGRIYRGQCRVGGEIGHLVEKFIQPNEWVVCERETCLCGPEIVLPKYKNC